jgi:O-succinylbenzoate synthase
MKADGPIHFWSYSLRSTGALNAVSARTGHPGALLRVGEGFGCLHPWPELGDPGLDELLASLARGEVDHPLLVGALECARLDGAARRAGRSLFAGPVPESHWLVREGDDPGFAKSDGFSLAKIKGTPDLARVGAQIEAWGEAGLRVRLDFNESLAPGAFLDFWKALGPERRELVDVVEDPEIWSEEGWQALREAGVPLAVDRDHTGRLRRGDVLVYKPAHYGFACGRETRFYVTSSMDHALGQMWAAAFASIASAGGSNDRLLPCGLLTHRCFEDDPFFERLRCDGPRLLPPGGTGLGFDDLLERLPWKRLN